jgi:hypothetical protein
LRQFEEWHLQQLSSPSKYFEDTLRQWQVNRLRLFRRSCGLKQAAIMAGNSPSSGTIPGSSCWSAGAMSPEPAAI